MGVEKISNKILLGLFLVSAVVIVLFFAVGYNRPYEEDNTMVDPKMTDVLLGWTIFLFIAALGLMIWSFFKYVKEWGFNKSYGYTWGLPIGTVLIGFIVGLIERDDEMVINGETWSNPGEMIISDICLISVGLLFLISIVAVIFSVMKESKK